MSMFEGEKMGKKTEKGERRILTFSEENHILTSKKISIEKFIPLARRFFGLYTGEFNSKFYDEEIVNAFNYVVDTYGVEMVAVYGPAFDVGCVEILKMALERKIKLYAIPKRRESVHFRLIDDKHVCMDNYPHKMLSGHHGGKFHFNDPKFGRKKRKDLEMLIRKAEYMSPQKIIEMVKNAREVREEDISHTQCFVRRDGDKAVPATDDEINHLRAELVEYFKEKSLQFTKDGEILSRNKISFKDYVSKILEWEKENQRILLD